MVRTRAWWQMTGGRVSAAALVMMTAGVAVGLVGCAPDPQSDDQNTEPTAQQDAPPNQAGEAPIVEISFEYEGEQVTVTGLPDRPFCEPEGAALWSTQSAADDAGASIPSRAGDDVPVDAWAVSDFGVLFTGKGAVLSQADGIVFGTAILGEALILERPSRDLRVAELDTDDAVRVEATLTFALECPAA